jgi:hypothetical protein
MGWNDSRVWLLAPGWTMVAEHNTTGAKAWDGAPVRILSLAQTNASESATVSRDALEGSLEARGFQLRQKRDLSSRLQWQDVEAFLSVEEGWVAGVELTFTLCRDCPLRWATWRSLVKQLCRDWRLALYDPNLSVSVEATQTMRVLSGTQAWRDFERRFNWPPAAGMDGVSRDSDTH